MGEASKHTVASVCAFPSDITDFVFLDFVYCDFSRNVVKEYVFNDPSFPDELVQGVNRDLMFQETGMQVIYENPTKKHVSNVSNVLTVTQ